MSNHAPGPWKLGIQDGNFVDIDSECHGGLAQAVWLMEDDEVEGRNSPQCEANAHLIAASPILYAALAPLADMITQYENNCGSRKTYTLQLGADAAKQIVDAVKAARGDV